MPQVTLEELIEQVYDRVENNRVFYPRDEVVDVINEGICVFNLFIGFLQNTVDLPGLTVAGRVIYDVPAPIIIPIRIQYEGRMLEPWAMSNIGYTIPDWMQKTSAMEGYPPQHWVPIGISKFGLHPADSEGGRVVSITGIIEPTPLVDDDDVIQFPIEVGNSFSDYCAHVLQLDEGGMTFKTSEAIYDSFLADVSAQSYLATLRQPYKNSVIRNPK
jgi:hypothetical protein